MQTELANEIFLICMSVGFLTGAIFAGMCKMSLGETCGVLFFCTALALPIGSVIMFLISAFLNYPTEFTIFSSVVVVGIILIFIIRFFRR